MHFGQQFREYREEYLHMRQKEAAYRLNLSPETLSNYERNERGFSVDLLPVVQKTFNIPTDYFMAMIMGEPLKSVREDKENQPIKTNELKERYMDSFIDRHRELFEESAELREFVALLSTLTEKDRRIFLNSNKAMLSLIFKRDKDRKAD
ncbi:helix-turn-helix transcriptional regulator [Sporosarcina sp. 179-K 3D1 HS]|uniref:helix-turn-helix domain-containing protein n=1 Tax=Sporosarcina sp. 179-K 3D1 HS TaxID=3232169 RepID=UPI00399F8474